MDIRNLDKKALDLAFSKAYEAVSHTDYRFEQDTLLYFYAYYKHAKKEYNTNLYREADDGERLVNAFKINALFQVRQLTEKECKIKYIELAIKHLGDEFLNDL